MYLNKSLRFNQTGHRPRAGAVLFDFCRVVAALAQARSVALTFDDGDALKAQGF